MNILELKIKQALAVKKEERKSVIEIGCNEKERLKYRFAVPQTP
jgi:hypothetical protein